MNLISIKDNIGIPKYKQIVASIEDALMAGLLKKGDKLPSINKVRNHFDLSRDTVLMAFNELKMRGIVESVSGKGYYIKSEDVTVKQKVFLFFDELNAFKEDIYNAFLEELSPQFQVDIFFHHFSYDVFKKQILDNVGSYNYYVIMPANLENVADVLALLPKEKVFLLDQTNASLIDYSAIYQNFEKDMSDKLTLAMSQISKYERIVLVYSPAKQPHGMLKGFQNFINSNQIQGEVISSLKERPLAKGEVYVTLDDRDLIVLIKKMNEQQLELGSDIGVISYNDTLLKEVVGNGITTISTDFKLMGTTLANMIKNGEQGQVENPSQLIIRKSL
ncbi:GntR family transcriptional regulator [Mangrovimonas sp. CR14]|uniref:GntR family transcriptional regulator n=1 Tax=Mangrovimonas sp. CR14 TaxID=2706120 RepID=UPI0014203CBB|nr:GntR family transcriptional regulator [Mangrovimonas sp. CR14]NIK91497.1 GntR family transcriptional regulator [Mangrovimonas sp. CR14]